MHKHINGKAWVKRVQSLFYSILIMMEIAGDKEPEGYTTCPYNPAHRLPLFRMTRHLVKCRQNHADAVMVICPLNIAHRVPQPELAYHVERCPDKMTVERKIYIPETIDRVVPIEAPDLGPPTDECWDDAANATYDPSKHVLENPILRIMNCESKGKRREFREEERNRIARIKEEAAATTSKTVHARELMNIGPGAQSRRPLTQSEAKRNLDPYRVNEMLQALEKDHKLLQDNLEMREDGPLDSAQNEDNEESAAYRY